MKKGEIKKCVKKTISKSKSVGYKKIRTRALDGYAWLTRNNILAVTSNDAEFKKFTVKFTSKAVPRPVTATELSYHNIYTPIFILISSSLTKETFVTETFARSKKPTWYLDKFFRIVKLKRFYENLSFEREKRGIYVY